MWQQSQIRGQDGLGVITNVAVDINWTLLPAIPLEDRNVIGIQNRSGYTIYLNYDNTATWGDSWNLDDGEQVFVQIKNGVNLYACTEAATVAIRVWEQV
jgi:hypothetical protein